MLKYFRIFLMVAPYILDLLQQIHDQFYTIESPEPEKKETPDPLTYT